MTKRARRRQKRPNAAAKALATGLYRPKVEIGGEVSPFGQALIDAVAAEPKSHQPEDHAK